MPNLPQLGAGAPIQNQLSMMGSPGGMQGGLGGLQGAPQPQPQPQQQEQPVKIEGSPVGGALGGLLGGALGYGAGKLKEEMMGGPSLLEQAMGKEDRSAETGMMTGAMLGAPLGSLGLELHQQGKLPSLQQMTGGGSEAGSSKPQEQPAVRGNYITEDQLQSFKSPETKESSVKTAKINPDTIESGVQHILQKTR